MEHASPNREWPQTAAAQFSRLPHWMRGFHRWIRWHGKANQRGDMAKVPLGKDWSVDVSLWHSEEQLAETVCGALDGVGLVFPSDGVPVPDGSSLVCLDLDACVEQNGDIAAWAFRIMQTFPEAFVCVSGSGSGLHLWMRAATRPKTFGKLMANAPSAGGSPKQAHAQVYGGRNGQFIALSTLRTRDPEMDGIVPDVDARLVSVFGEHAVHRAQRDYELAVVHPIGDDIASEVLDQRLKLHAPFRLALERGDLEQLQWRGSVDVSYAWSRICQHALLHSNFHTDTVIDYMLGDNAFSNATADVLANSAEPSKYGKRSWVVARVNREAIKLLNGQYRPPAAAELQRLFGEHAPLDAQQSVQMVYDNKTVPLAADLDDDYPNIYEHLYETEPEKWVIDGLIPQQGVGVFYAQENAGKSLWCMALAHRIASGRSFTSQHPVSRPGRVLFICGEDIIGMGGRNMAQTLLDNDMQRPDHTLPIFINSKPSQLDLTRPGSLEKVLVKAEASPHVRVHGQGMPLRMVVIDTLSTNMTGSDADSDDASTALRELNRVSLDRNLLVIVVTHVSKKDRHAPRGHTVITGNSDFTFRVDGGGKSDHTRLIPVKCRNWPPARPITARIQGVDLPNDSWRTPPPEDQPPVNRAGLVIEDPVADAFAQPTQEPGPEPEPDAAQQEAPGVQEQIQRDALGFAEVNMARMLGNPDHVEIIAAYDSFTDDTHDVNRTIVVALLNGTVPLGEWINSVDLAKRLGFQTAGHWRNLRSRKLAKCIAVDTEGRGTSSRSYVRLVHPDDQ